MAHTIRTSHIRQLLEQAHDIAEAVDGSFGDTLVDLPSTVSFPAGDPRRCDHALAKAAQAARHAAEELEAERLECYGWRQ